MKVRNVANGKTADVPEVLGRRLIASGDFVAADEGAGEAPSAVVPKKKGKYRRRDMRAEQ